MINKCRWKGGAINWSIDDSTKCINWLIDRYFPFLKCSYRKFFWRPSSQNVHDPREPPTPYLPFRDSKFCLFYSWMNPAMARTQHWIELPLIQEDWKFFINILSFQVKISRACQIRIFTHWNHLKSILFGNRLKSISGRRLLQEREHK